MELEEGENIFTLKAEDEAGNQSDPPPTLTVTKTDRRAEEIKYLCFQVFIPGSDPIDAFTGGQILEHQLLTVKGAVPLNFTLRYDSSQGPQWVDKYFSSYLEEQSHGEVKIYWEPLRYNRLTPQAEGHYQARHKANSPR